ncbi:MAG TPA: DUF5939 domain-containing protein [Opitutaceae bacterium]|jgi:class 3 adenylate cyclase|nr:DUF5939 domain-containing protein [Opitutaceae bacterium]
MPSELHYRWTWELAASPEALWPLVSNTDRFNRDCGFPPVEVIAHTGSVQRLRAKVMGLVIEWDEQPFEWLAPHRFGVERIYHRGPLGRFSVQCRLAPRGGNGTTLDYEVKITPAGLLGRLAVPAQIGGQMRSAIDRVMRRYDEFAQQGLAVSLLAQKPALAPGASVRLAAVREKLIAALQAAPLVEKLAGFVATADDFSAARIRPYALADAWNIPRREVLQLCLHATRAGLLDFRWDVLCPQCRGPKAGAPALSGLSSQVHCDTCQIDFTASFDQSVELTFSPNPAIRAVARADYCVGGPQVTPHVVAQQRLAPAETCALALTLKPGRYRVRLHQVSGQQIFRIAHGGPADATLRLAAGPNENEEFTLGPEASLELVNEAGVDRLAIVEHLAWSDQAATAAEVTALQAFRDLFCSEVLRPGEQLSVGTLTLVFTDLKNSTQLYKEIGDAPAFGRVLTHFEILKAAVAAEGGAVVKTMGDAIMAVFPRPIAALQAMRTAQRQLACPEPIEGAGRRLPPPLALKAGIHCGPCLAINQNDRLDYFGTTVNVAARLCALCAGTDLVLSASARTDPEISALLAAETASFAAHAEMTPLKGFPGESFEIWRLTPPAKN